MHFAVRTCSYVETAIFQCIKKALLFNQMQMQLFIVESENALCFDAMHIHVYSY